LKVSVPAGVQVSDGVGLGLGDPGVGEGVGDGECDGEGDGEGDGDGDGEGDGEGAAARRPAADSGWFRLGAAAINTDRMPSHEIPTVTAVATAQAAR
jgi:hypothetical protein